LRWRSSRRSARRDGVGTRPRIRRRRPGIGRVRCVRRIGRLGRRCRRTLDLAQPRIEVDVEIALALLRLLELVGDDLDLPAQLRDVALQKLQLIGEIGESLPLHALLERRETVLDLPLQLRDAEVRRLDAPACLVVVEQCRVRRMRADQQYSAHDETQPQALHRQPFNHRSVAPHPDPLPARAGRGCLLHSPE